MGAPNLCRQVCKKGNKVFENKTTHSKEFPEEKGPELGRSGEVDEGVVDGRGLGEEDGDLGEEGRHVGSMAEEGE